MWQDRICNQIIRCMISENHLNYCLEKKKFYLFAKLGEGLSVVSDSLWPHGLYSPWNYPGQNTGEGSLSLLQGIFPTQESNPDLLHCRQILYQLSHKGSPRMLEWVAYPTPSPADLPNSGIKLGFPALQADSLPTELPGKPYSVCTWVLISIFIVPWIDLVYKDKTDIKNLQMQTSSL